MKVDRCILFSVSVQTVQKINIWCFWPFMIQYHLFTSYTVVAIKSISMLCSCLFDPIRNLNITQYYSFEFCFHVDTFFYINSHRPVLHLVPTQTFSPLTTLPVFNCFAEMVLHTPFFIKTESWLLPSGQIVLWKLFINERESFVMVDLYHYLELPPWAMQGVTFVQTLFVVLGDERRHVRKMYIVLAS